MNRPTKTQKPARLAAGAGFCTKEQNRTAINTTEYTTAAATWQLSPDSLTRIAYLAGDLANFYLGVCQRFTNFPDPAFDEPFSRACDLLTIEDTLLRRAAKAVFGGEG